ncbi:MAG: SUMF1/EgtB/PvdO family nonheme iron enzyme [Ignavibacteriaceae bacterium]|nr:SUMF1/EgtB/PvdO family nonheme iron enzyme [Ignavibacteriaceae bacterium]
MQKIRDYRIISLLGEGGMGKVYLAEDEMLERKVAIKMLNPELGSNQELLARFRQEAKVQANLHHPNIVTLFTYFVENNNHCIVMEYAPGKTLKQIIREKGKLSENETLSLLKGMLDGLGYAHQYGVVHRDIKPANIMVSEEGNVKIMDFGIAKVLGDRGLTRTGLKMGTVYYMSPEQVKADKDIDQRTDIYSLGITLYEMLSGTVPFTKNTDSDFIVMQDIVSGNIDYHLLANDGISNNLLTVLKSLTETDKNNRPPTCMQVEKLLDGKLIPVENKEPHKKPAPEIKIIHEPVQEQKRLEHIDKNVSLSHQHMVLVEGGSFIRKEKKLIGYREQSVKLDSFYISKYQVTQEEWEFVMGKNPSHFRGERNLPVEKVSWFDSVEFCNKLSEKEGLQKVYSGSWDNITMNMNADGYRLPTEAEWEYAARGGSLSKGYEYSGSNNSWEVAWYYVNSNNNTHPVGQKQPNELGIYDMSGNVWEWCWDWYGNYSSDSQNNPAGPVSGSDRVNRGGSWFNDAGNLRPADRYGSYPVSRHDNLGFRIARTK